MRNFQQFSSISPPNRYTCTVARIAYSVTTLSLPHGYNLRGSGRRQTVGHLNSVVPLCVPLPSFARKSAVIKQVTASEPEKDSRRERERARERVKKNDPRYVTRFMYMRTCREQERKNSTCINGVAALCSGRLPANASRFSCIYYDFHL